MKHFPKKLHCRCSTGFYKPLWMRNLVHYNLKFYEVLIQPQVKRNLVRSVKTFYMQLASPTAKQLITYDI